MGHTFVSGIKELFVRWLKLTIRAVKYKNFSFLKMLHPAWTIIFNNITINTKHHTYSFDNCIKSVQGLVSHVSTYLFCLGWKDPKFSHWIDTQGNQMGSRC